MQAHCYLSKLITSKQRQPSAILITWCEYLSKAVIGLLTRHNTLTRHLHILGLTYSSLCRKCGAEEETSAHVLCECEALATLTRTHLGSFFLEPEDIKGLNLRVIWNFTKRAGLLWLECIYGAQRVCKKPTCIGTTRDWPIIYSILFYSNSFCYSLSCSLHWSHQRRGWGDWTYMAIKKCNFMNYTCYTLMVIICIQGKYAVCLKQKYVCTVHKNKYYSL
jgi:hypothetical protein